MVLFNDYVFNWDVDFIVLVKGGGGCGGDYGKYDGCYYDYDEYDKLKKCFLLIILFGLNMICEVLKDC